MSTLCINHPEEKSDRICRVCRKFICDNCFSKYEIRKGRKRIGFCSSDCYDNYQNRMRGIRNKNRAKSFKYFFYGFVSIAISLMILFITTIWEPDISGSVMSEVLGRILVNIWLFFFCGGVILILYGLFALINGENPDNFKNPITDRDQIV